MNGACPIERVPEVMERRCRKCGARVRGKRCGDCGERLQPRAEIGILAGVNENYGTVQTVYNITPAMPEVVDVADVQASLNAMYPERVPITYVNEPRLLPRGARDTVVRALNWASYVWAAVIAVSLVSLFWYLLK